MAAEFDVFLSYSHSDRQQAAVIEQELAAGGFDVWRDTSSTVAGERIRERVSDALRASACVVIVLSRRSLNSPWVLNELDAAMLREIRERRTVVIPVLLGRVSIEDLPPDLQGKLVVDLRYDFPRRLDVQRGALLAAVRAALQPPGPADPVEVGRQLVALLMSTDVRVRGTDGEYTEEAAEEVADELIRLLEAAHHAPEYVATRKDFLEEYGRYALRQMCLYLWGVAEKDVSTATVVDSVNTLLLMFDFAPDLRKQGITLMFGLTASGESIYWSKEAARLDSG